MTGLRRLKSRNQFLQVAATRRKWVAPGLILQARQRPPEEDRATQNRPEKGAECRDLRDIGVGFTVSRKVGNAVARNRARRRLRAAAQALLPEAGLPGQDYVLIGRKTTLTRSYGDLLADLGGALAGIGRKGRNTAKRTGRP